MDDNKLDQNKPQKKPKNDPRKIGGGFPASAYQADVPPPPIVKPSKETAKSEGEAKEDIFKKSGSVPIVVESEAETEKVEPLVTTPASQVSREEVPVVKPVETPVEPQVKTPTEAIKVPDEEVVSPPSPKRKFPKVILIILGIFAVLITVFVIYRFISGMGRGAPGKEAEIVWWGLWEDESLLAPLITEYEQANPNVKISYIKQSPQDYRERLTNALAKGQGPDIFRFHNSWVPMFYKELDNVPPSVMSAADFSQTYYPVITSDLSIGTGIVGIPLGYDALTLFVNETVFKEAGVEYPTNWVDLRKAAQALTKKENEEIVQAGIALGRTENVDHWPEVLGLMLIQNGANMANPEGSNVEDAITYFTVFSRRDQVWDETLPPSTAAFASGKLAMYFGPSWRAFNITEQNPDLKFKTIPLPQLPKENPKEPNVSYATYWVEGVWTRSKNKDAAWDFLKFISSKQSLEKLYQNASRARGFGEAYPRVDMGELLLDHPVLGSIIGLAPEAHNWYLVDRTFDGTTGINSQVNKYFEDAINALNDGEQMDDVMRILTPGVIQVLTQYGLVGN